MKLEITKADFESAVPAAREPKGKIYEVMLGAINAKADVIAMTILGEPGVKAVEEGEDDLAKRLRQNTIRLACIGAFLDEMRGLDLVLTSTGFGVVSTQDTAPASKMRVDALEGELRRKQRMVRDTLLSNLFSLKGWSDTPQRRGCVETLFFQFELLETCAGVSHPKPEDWDNNVPVMLAADNYLRKHIGNAYMEELIDGLTSHSLTVANVYIVMLIQKYIGAAIAQNRQLQNELYMRIINRMEDNLSLYPTYAGSDAYRLNHFKPYENKAEDTAFHFVG